MEVKDILKSNPEEKYISQEKMLDIIDGLKLDESIELTDIPNLDLYMDQVITLFEEKLSHTKRYEEDKLLTKTMINNYAKDRLLMPAKKKKYTREHILLMIMLYELKQILSIGDIKDLFNIVVKEGEVDTKKLEKIYEIYLLLRKSGVTAFKEDIREISLSIEDKVSNVFMDESWGVELNDNVDAEIYDVEETYDSDSKREVDEKKELGDEQKNNEENKINQEKNSDVNELRKMNDMLTVVTLIQRANYYKRLAEKIIDDKLKD